MRHHYVNTDLERRGDTLIDFRNVSHQAANQVDVVLEVVHEVFRLVQGFDPSLQTPLPRHKLLFGSAGGRKQPCIRRRNVRDCVVMVGTDKCQS